MYYHIENLSFAPSVKQFWVEYSNINACNDFHYMF